MANSDDNQEIKSYEPTEEEQKLLDKWEKRFTYAKEYRDPIQDKWLRMYKLFRAYRDEQEYSYHTNLMPANAFQIIQTIVSRLAIAEREVRILPKTKEAADKKEEFTKWEEYIDYVFQQADLGEKQKMLMQHSAMYGDGIIKLGWDNDKDRPFLDIIDLWDFFPDPDATDDKDLNWAIQRKVKPKDELDDDIYDNLDSVTGQQPEDLKKDRYEINGKKMGQVAGSKDTSKTEGDTLPTKDTKRDEDMVEVLEIWDFKNDKIIALANQRVVIRNEDNPYESILEGIPFIDLPDHKVHGEFWNIGHLEPVETVIQELADLRNQRLENTALMLNPVVKVEKDSGVETDDIVFEPGAIWKMQRHDHVMIERPPGVSPMGQNEDKMLRNEISRTLALSEYMQGTPQSSQEPASKVSMLLKQGNLRMNLNSDSLERVFTRIVNGVIQLTQEFASEEMNYFVDEEDVREFKEFGQKDIGVNVEADVKVDPITPKSQQARVQQDITLYDLLVGKDKPQGKDQGEIKQWKQRKRALQEMILRDMDKSEHIPELLGEEENEPQGERAEPQQQQKTPVKPTQPMQGVPQQRQQQRQRNPEPRQPQQTQGRIEKIAQKIPYLRNNS